MFKDVILEDTNSRVQFEASIALMALKNHISGLCVWVEGIPSDIHHGGGTAGAKKDMDNKYRTEIEYVTQILSIDDGDREPPSL